MRVYLIRHAETVHNVGQVWAGTTDSALTNHGMQQIEHLAEHFARNSVQFTSVFASDLSRARVTAEGICRLQRPHSGARPATPILTPHLRERDYGSLEGSGWWSSPAAHGDGHARPGRSGRGPPKAAVEPESDASMERRAHAFLQEHFLPLLRDHADPEASVAVVAHGVILRVLWNCLSQLFNRVDVTAPGVASWDGNLAAALAAPVWSNTGYMDLLIERIPAEAASTGPAAPRDLSVSDSPLEDWSLAVLAVNSRDHLGGLHRARGGIGSAVHDTRQKKIDQFFK